MVLTCCAYGCKMRFVKGNPTTFHSFPKDIGRRKLWLFAIRRKNFTPGSGSKVCSKHFQAKCFDTQKFGGTWLKPDAVPTIFNFPECLEPEEKHRKSWRRKRLLSPSPETREVNNQDTQPGEMRSCCVPLCDSIRGKDKIPYHEMPSNHELREQWIEIIYEHGTNVGTESVRPINPDDFVCGRHFTADDYKPSNKARYLKSDAIPSVFPLYSLKSSLAKQNGVLNVTSSSKSKKQIFNIIAEQNFLSSRRRQANVLSDQNSHDPATLNCEAKKVKIKKGKRSARKGITPSKKLKTDTKKETGSSEELPDVIFVDEKPVGLETLKKLSSSAAVPGAKNSLGVLCSTKGGNTSLSSDAIADSCTFETSNKLNPKSSSEFSKDSVTDVHKNSVETSSPASLQEKLDLAKQKIKNLQNYVTKLKEQNVKLHWEKQSTLVKHVHDIRRDAVEGNYDAIMLLNQVVHYALQRT